MALAPAGPRDDLFGRHTQFAKMIGQKYAGQQCRGARPTAHPEGNSVAYRQMQSGCMGREIDEGLEHQIVLQRSHQRRIAAACNDVHLGRRNRLNLQIELHRQPQGIEARTRLADVAGSFNRRKSSPILIEAVWSKALRSCDSIPMLKSALIALLVAIPAAAQTPPSTSLAQHDFVLWPSRDHYIFIVRHGQVVWSYDDPAGKGEISDCVMLSNGNLLIAHQFGVKLITPEKKILWSYDPPPAHEVHTAIPIGTEHVLYVQNGDPALVRVCVAH